MSIVHIHKRKRENAIKKKLRPYPSKNKWVHTLDRFLIILAVIGPLMTLPQVFKIYVGKNVSGISIITWTLNGIFNVPWIIYGIIHKEKPIVITYILWFIMNVSVVIGCILFR